MRSILISAVAATVMTAPAYAQDKSKYPFWPWVQAGSYEPPNRVHITMWVNMESIRRAGDGVMEVWIKYKNDRLDDAGSIESLIYERLDCRRNWHAAISIMRYGREGKLVYSSKSKPDMEPIVPDSLLAGMMPFTCAAGGMPQ
jgi:hypothetical protein